MPDINTILLVIGVVFAVLVAFLVPTLLELKKTSAQGTIFLKNTEESVNRTLAEVEETMRSIRTITDDINKVTSNASEVSSSVLDLAEGIKAAGESVEKLSCFTSKKISGIRAGIIAGTEVFVRNLISRGGRK